MTTSITLPANASSQQLRECLAEIDSQGWDLITISSLDRPNKVLKMCPRNKFILALLDLDNTVELLLTEW